MKKFYAFALSLLVALSAMAVTPKATKMGARKAAQSALTERVSLKHEQALKQSRSMMAKAARVEEGDDAPECEAILNPEGEVRNYSNKAAAFTYMWGILDYNEHTFPTVVVWGEDGDVYIRDLVSSTVSGVYVKGHYEDGKVTVQLPQICYYEDFYDEEDPESEHEYIYLYATVAEYYSYVEGDTEYFSYKNCEAEDCVLVYDVDEDGTLLLTLNDFTFDEQENLPERIIALVEDTTPGVDDWFGYGDSHQELSVFDAETATLPEGIELEQWAIISNNSNYHAMVGFDGDDVYLTDFWEYAPEFVAKGQIQEDGKVSFGINQYLGEVMGYYCYLSGFEWEDEDFFDGQVVELVFDYDAEAKKMAVNNPLIDMIFNGNTEEYEVLDYYEDPTILYQTDEMVNAAPQDPWVKFFDEYGYVDWLGAYEGHINWIIPDVNVNGALLDTEKMYYHFLLDDEVMTFTEDLYPYFEEEFTDIPYNYSDDWDLQTLGESHYFSFKWEFYNTFGCQSFFIGTDGETYASNLVTYEPSGINAIATDGRQIKAVEYYDLQGHRLSRAAQGLNIARILYTDGTSSVAKIVK